MNHEKDYKNKRKFKAKGSDGKIYHGFKCSVYESIQDGDYKMWKKTGNEYVLSTGETISIHGENLIINNTGILLTEII